MPDSEAECEINVCVCVEQAIVMWCQLADGACRIITLLMRLESGARGSATYYHLRTIDVTFNCAISQMSQIIEVVSSSTFEKY